MKAKGGETCHLPRDEGDGEEVSERGTDEPEVAVDNFHYRRRSIYRSPSRVNPVSLGRSDAFQVEE